MAESTRENKFKLGLFASNAWGGLTKTLAPERWEASWENNVTVARMAEDAGLDFLLPFAVWTSLHGDAPSDGHCLESLTWAAATLAETDHITVFGTVHSPFVNPIFAAKQATTCERVGSGRFGLNVVSGFNQADFELFGVDMLDHDERYAYTEEWITIVRRVWTESEPFDFDGKYFNLKAVKGNPLPAGRRPPIVNAGSSPAGRSFAAQHADILFMVIGDVAHLPEELNDFRALTDGRTIGAYASGHVICRQTAAEAADYHHYIVHEHGDWSTTEYLKSVVSKGSQSWSREQLDAMLERLISGQSTYLVQGSPDDVAHEFKRMSDAGLDGMAFALVNYLEDFPIIRDEVLPRLERLGLRAPAVAYT